MCVKWLSVGWILVQALLAGHLSAWVQEPSPGSPTEPATPEVPIQIDGVLIETGKYSLTVKGLAEDYKVVIPNGTPILLRLTRPEFDLSANRVTITLPISAPDGDAKKNTQLVYPLPSPLFLHARFADARRRERIFSSSDNTIARFELAARQHPSWGNETTELTGQLVAGATPGELLLQMDNGSVPIQLGKRHGLLHGFTILDLKPDVTDLFVTGEMDGQQLVASRIEFAHVGDPLPNENPELARCLFLGDSVSFNYQRPLRQALAGKVNLHHPPTTCGGSSNWRQIHRWLGNYMADDRGWDVITFNFGLHDQVTTKAAYQTNLRRAVGQLKQTGAKLIWVTTTPIPDGFDADPNAVQPIGHVPGRMKLQNRWAAEVMKEFPEIAICDLWSLVDQRRDSTYEKWWQGNQYGFEYSESVPLARELGRHILEVLGSGELNPMSVHNLRVTPRN